MKSIEMRSNQELNQELTKQLGMMYSVMAIVLWKFYGWRKERIYKLVNITQEVWEECANYGTEKSMLEILEEETGIEIAMPGKKSYHELKFLDASTWDGKPPTKMEFLYIREQQKVWLPSLLLACICIALHRKEKWADERIGKFVNYVQDLRMELGKNPKPYYKHLEEETGIGANEFKVKISTGGKQNG